MMEAMSHSPAQVLNITLSAGRMLKATPVYDTYWRFAAERQALFMRRINGSPFPWTDDPVLAGHRFTNVYRASDRVSQYLIANVLYKGSDIPEEVLFRTLLFKVFNRIDTWEELLRCVGEPSWRTFDYKRYANALDNMFARRQRVYSAAYIMPSPHFGSPRKHRNHLLLIEHIIRDGGPGRIARARSLREVFEVLGSYPSIGDFLAFQYAIDLNYSELLHFSEMDFVVAGPGARDGISKCFFDTSGLSESDIIRVVADRANVEFERLGLEFPTLWGRPLQLIDCQNVFCEVSKYSRVAHPEFLGSTGRVRIKQKYKQGGPTLPQWYPPKWGLRTSLNSHREIPFGNNTRDNITVQEGCV
jgi:hypothetical protein